MQYVIIKISKKKEEDFFMKKFLCVILATLMLITFCTGCSKSNVENSNNSIQENDSIVDSTTGSEIEKVYKYKAYGLQNVADVGDLYYNEEKNSYYSYFTEFYCPKCGDTIWYDHHEPKIQSNDVGKETIIWADEVCCNNTHDDQFFNGWFNVSIQYVLVEE